MHQHRPEVILAALLLIRMVGGQIECELKRNVFVNFDRTLMIRVKELEIYDEDKRLLMDSHLLRGCYYHSVLFAFVAIVDRQCLDQREFVQTPNQINTMVNFHERCRNGSREEFPCRHFAQFLFEHRSSVKIPVLPCTLRSAWQQTIHVNPLSRSLSLAFSLPHTLSLSRPLSP